MASPRVCIYTAISGRYDDLKAQPAQSVACDFVCFADDPTGLEGAGWDVRPLPPLPGASARLAAKLPKILPHRVLADYDATIWIDASVRILRPSFAETLLDAARATGLAFVRHPERDCVFDELEASSGAASKYDAAPRRDQLAAYAAEGYPRHNGLLAGGVVVRDTRSAVVRDVCERWWAEIVRRSPQDQLSLPYVLWTLGAPFATIDLDLWRNPLFEVMPHLAVEDPALRPRPFRARDGGDALCSYDPKSGLWAAPGVSAFAFGPAGGGLLPLAGDWDGDGLASPGLYDPATGSFFLTNRWESGPADVEFRFGPPGALPVAGDWTGARRDSVGLYLPDAGRWALANRLEPGPAEIELGFGAGGGGLVPVAGDWGASGHDGVGLYDPKHAGWFLLDDLRDGATARMLSFGPVGAVPLAGDWNADGVDEVGVFVPERSLVLLADGEGRTTALVDPVGAVPLVVRTA